MRLDIADQKKPKVQKTKVCGIRGGYCVEPGTKQKTKSGVCVECLRLLTMGKKRCLRCGRKFQPGCNITRTCLSCYVYNTTLE